MDLFKARKRAEEEYRTAVARAGLSEAELAARSRRRRPTRYPRHVVAGTGANQVLELGGVRVWEGRTRS
jgi:hypothetical protein